MWSDLKYSSKCLWKRIRGMDCIQNTCITLMYILLNFWSFILYLICTSVHSISMAKLAFFKTWFSQVSFTIQPANKHPYRKNQTIPAQRNMLTRWTHIGCISDSCLRTTTGFLFQSHFYTILILPSPVQYTQQIIPSFPDMQASISTFLNIYFCVCYEWQGHLLHGDLAP